MRVQCLAGCPAGVGRAFGLDHEQSFEGYAGGGQGWCVGLAGGRDADGPAPGRSPGQYRQEQAEFAHAGMGNEQFGECADRPAAAGQGCIE